jgi:hypothetical protein
MRFYTCAVNILLKGKHQVLLVCFLGYLYASASLPLACYCSLQCRSPVLCGLFQSYRKGARTGPTFSSPIVQLTLYPLPSFRRTVWRPTYLVSIWVTWIYKICRCFDSAYIDTIFPVALQSLKDADKHPCLERDSNPRSQQPTGQDPRLRPHGHCDRHFDTIVAGMYNTPKLQCLKLKQLH